MKNNLFPALVCVLLSSVAQADVISCVVEQTFGTENASDGRTDFENVKDFTFEEYPYLLVKGDMKDPSGISVGAMVYDKDDEYVRMNALSTTSGEYSGWEVSYDEQREVRLEYDSFAKEVTLYAFNGLENEEAPVKTAVFSCN